jgi:hypothetical protein
VLGDFIQKQEAAQQQREQSAAMYGLTFGNGSGADGMGGGTGLTLGGGNGPGLRAGGLQARAVVQDEQLGGDGNAAMYEKEDWSSIKRGQATVAQDQGPLAALRAAGLSQQQAQAMYGQMLRNRQITLDADGVPQVQLGQVLDYNLSDMSGAALGGRAIGRETSGRVAADLAAQRKHIDRNDDKLRRGVNEQFGEARLDFQWELAQPSSIFTPKEVPGGPGYKALSSAAGMVTDGLGVLAGSAMTVAGVTLIAAPEPTTLTKWAGVPLTVYGGLYTTKSAVGFGLNTTNLVTALRGISQDAAYMPGSALEWLVRANGGSPELERVAVAVDMGWGLASGKVLDARLATGAVVNPRIAALVQPATFTSVNRETTIAAPQVWNAWTRLDPKAGGVDLIFKTNDNIVQPLITTPDE